MLENSRELWYGFHVKNARRPRSGTSRATGRSPARGGRLGTSATERKRYPPRTRPRILTVSEGGRSATILVGPVRGPEHLNLIRRVRFYHVPVSAIARSRTAVAYIAFYEGASRFRGRTGAIREYARVLRVSQVRRAELPGLTWPGRRGEDALYYRFDLGAVEKFPRAITNPDGLRVVFRFPEFERLRSAETVRDLGKVGPRQPKRGKS